MRGLALVVVVVCGAGCFDVEPCEVQPVEIVVPGDCWEDAACTGKVAADDVCGRAYVCPHEWPDGSVTDTCMVARDCDCLEQARACGEVVYWPRYCDL